MTNSKKKKTEEVITAWQELKNKIQNNWKEGKVLTFRPFTKPIEAAEEIKNQVRMIKNYQEDEREFQRERTSFTKLESKLEMIRNLIADGELEKLKRMCKKGEI